MQSKAISKLMAEQETKKWSDRQMAQALGISRQRYQQLRTGHSSKMGGKVIKAIMQNRKELSAELLSDMGEAK